MSQRPRRSSRGGAAASIGRYQAAEGGVPEEELEELEASRRRKGKALRQQAEEDDEDYHADEDGEQATRERLHSGQLAGSRQGQAGDDEAAPSAKRRRGTTAAVKTEPRGGDAPGSSQHGAPHAAAAKASSSELRGLDELIAEYRRVRDHTAEKAEGKAPRMAMEQASRALVRHMLFAHAEKPGVPVKRTEVSAVVTQRFSSLKAKGAVTAYVIAHAQHYLLSALGLEMRSMAKAAPRGREGGPAADEGSQQFVLRSAVPQALRAAFVLDASQSAERGLLMVVLALLNLAGGKLEEDELHSQLAELGVVKDEAHPVLGSLEAQLKSFCTRRYIQQEKQAGPEGDVIRYRFAEQAVGPDAEIGEQAIQKFIEDRFPEGAAGGARA